MLDNDAPELGLIEGEGLDHVHREQCEPRPLLSPSTIRCRSSAVPLLYGRQESMVPQTTTQSSRLTRSWAEIFKDDQRCDSCSFTYSANTITSRTQLRLFSSAKPRLRSSPPRVLRCLSSLKAGFACALLMKSTSPARPASSGVRFLDIELAPIAWIRSRTRRSTPGFTPRSSCSVPVFAMKRSMAATEQTC